ncbi:MAG: hypothetical protein IKQ35_05060 [Bacilli bacterium]|nr:hypothetical protein [Bacilli bacterium]
MKKKIVLSLLCNLMLFPLTTFAIEDVDLIKEDTESNEVVEKVEENNIDNNEEKEDSNVVSNDEKEPEVLNKEATTEELNGSENEETLDEETDENESSENEVPKVSVLIKKEDEHGNYLAGATLQILDQDGNVVAEWVSGEEDYNILLPEGEYTLHEVLAPKGYLLADDQKFTVEIKITDVTAGVVHDDSHEVCWHYKGVPLFYIENEDGSREEVYCINQNWEEPHDISYDGVIVTEDNILTFIPDADPTMSGKEMYDRVLDIIYHRTKVEEEYPDLTNTEIRFVTEYAIKNYTSAQFDNGNWARRYAYSETNERGYVVDPGNGTTLGKLAQHWYTSDHHAKIPKKYADLYYYLIRDEDHHPDDMYLYLYSTQAVHEDGPYQNLLGIRWFNPYDSEHEVKVTMVNEKGTNPETGDDINIYYAMSLFGLGSVLSGLFFLKKD